MLLDLLLHHHRAPISGGAGRTNGAQISPSGVKQKRKRTKQRRERDLLFIGRPWTL